MILARRHVKGELLILLRRHREQSLEGEGSALSRRAPVTLGAFLSAVLSAVLSTVHAPQHREQEQRRRTWPGHEQGRSSHEHSAPVEYAVERSATREPLFLFFLSVRRTPSAAA